MKDRRVEVLAPAGDMERLIMVLAYGADAVYLAGENFGLRAAAGNFDEDGMRTALQLCREHNANMYVTCNAVLKNREMQDLPQFLERLEDIKADALIISDMGVFSLAKKYAPSIPIHISTQAGVMNYESARMLHDMGASRVILARELTIEDIAEIRAKTPRELQLEAFVHGSMCVSFSGRCLLSNYMTGRDANSGDCAQPCRWKYYLMEEKRPGEYLELVEDNGTYIMNSRDLCMIDHIPELLDAGVDSIKIEGRTKSAYYAAVITNAYRHAADAAMRGEPLPDIWREEVNKVSHREYSTGFYFNESGPGQYYNDSMYSSVCDIVAMVESCDEEGNAILTQRNKFFVGDALELLTPENEPVSFIAGCMHNAASEEITDTPHPMMEFRLKLPQMATKLSILRKPR